MARNLYFGIDLGTTNSVAAWGQENKDGKFITKAVELRVLDEKRNPSKEKMLPSCVYYKQGEPPTVGAYARRMLSTQSRRVIKSAKSSMGTGRKYRIDDKEITPAEVSSLILKQIAVSSREFNLGLVPDDAVITVPASFDPDQRADTNEAAKLAGFRLNDDDGRFRNILLNEPTAALYDFLNRQDNEEIPEVLDLSEKKVILVFDIGGGTLDVSLHEVTRNNDPDNALPYDIRPLAISRHTLLGGDNFDELLQRFLIDKLVRIDIDALGEIRADAFRSDILDTAEKAKIELNSRVEIYRNQGIDDYNSMNISCEILRPYIGDTDYGIDYELTLQEYRQIMKPYLAPDLTMASVNDLDALSCRTDNIIYPVLDVLDKAKSKLGSVPQIDAVLMNGGMSKLFAIRERIQEFFGFPPLEVGDPDLAVARGASVYHYWRHKGIKTPEIQNDDIGIAVQGGGLQKLIYAGTTLPFTTEIFTFEIPKDDAERIDLPFYKGSRSDTQPPNRRIATRRISLAAPQKAGTLIQLKGLVNEAGTLSLNVWRSDEPGILYTVDNVHTDMTETELPPVFVIPEGGFKKKPAESLPKSGAAENIPLLVKKYDRILSDHDTNRLKQDTKYYMTLMKNTEVKILSASNCGEAIDEVAKIMGRFYRESKRAARLLGRLARNSSAQDSERAAKHLIRMCNPRTISENLGKVMTFASLPKTKMMVQCTAIQALSTLRRPEDEKLFLELLRLRPFPVAARTLTQELCYALGRAGHTQEAVLVLAECIRGRENSERIAAYWALGRVASREREDRVPASVLEMVLPSVLRCMESERHSAAFCNGIYALGEMCDQRIPVEKVSVESAAKADTLLERLSLFADSINAQAKGYIHIALNMIRGTALSTEQEEVLLKLRDSALEDD